MAWGDMPLVTRAPRRDISGGTMTDPGSGPSPSGGTGTGASASASSAHGTVPAAPVPQQYEPRADEREQYEREQYGRDWYGRGDETAARDVRGDELLATAARHSWPVVAVGALGMIAIGVALLVWPHASLTVVAILIGAAIIVSGLARLWEGLTASDRSGGTRAAYIVIGLLAVLIGLYCLRQHALSLFIVTFLISVYFIAHGIADIGVALSARVPGRGVRAVLGVCSLAAGIIILIWPAITLVLLLTIAAAWLLFYGLVLGGLAFSLWRAGRTLSRSARSGRMAAAAA
jgi:uncharacterized membrane protein HdeD (DUF308 family)